MLAILSRRTVLLLGNGPSVRPWLSPDRLWRARTALADPLVVACNLTALDVDCDLAAAHDKPMVAELVGRGLHRRVPIAGPRMAFSRIRAERQVDHSDLELDRNYLPIENASEGWSTGVALFREALVADAEAIVLVGFDGEADPRSIHQGREHYRTRPTSRELFAIWERRMAEIATDERARGNSTRIDLVGARPLHPLEPFVRSYQRFEEVVGCR